MGVSDRVVVGIDLGGTHMQVGVVDGSGAVRAREGFPTLAHEGADAVIDRIAQNVRAVTRGVGLGPEDLHAVGLGAPGVIDPLTDDVVAAPNLKWYGVPVVGPLSERLGGARVVIDNDVNVAAYGEGTIGAAAGCQDLFAVWVGTGIGGGFMLGGKVYRGGLGTAGEIGMTVWDPAAPTGEERMEHLASRKYVARRIRAAIEDGGSSLVEQLTNNDLERISASVIREAYDRNDRVTRRVVDHAAEVVGCSIANAVTVTAVPVVVLGGGLTEALGAAYVERVAQAVRRFYHPASMADRIDVRLTKLRENAGLLGAAMLARDA